MEVDPLLGRRVARQQRGSALRWRGQGDRHRDRQIAKRKRARRTPYDGTLSRESAETLAATSVLDVPGKKLGTVSSDLAYGLTLYMVGYPSMLDSAHSIAAAAGATRLLEPGIGEDGRNGVYKIAH
jgi:hypothetical protein